MFATVLRVSMDGKSLGELIVSNDRIQGGAKSLKRSLGKRTANAVILMVLACYTKFVQDCGQFQVAGKTFGFSPVAETKKKAG